MIIAHTVLVTLHLLSRVSIPSVVFIFTIILSPQSIYLPVLFRVFPPSLRHSFPDLFTFSALLDNSKLEGSDAAALTEVCAGGFLNKKLLINL